MSLDGSRVALYEQWETLEECKLSYGELSLATAVRTSLKFVVNIDESSVERHLYETVSEKGSEPMFLDGDLYLVQLAEVPNIHNLHPECLADLACHKLDLQSSTLASQLTLSASTILKSLDEDTTRLVAGAQYEVQDPETFESHQENQFIYQWVASQKGEGVFQ